MATLTIELSPDEVEKLADSIWRLGIDDDDRDKGYSNALESLGGVTNGKLVLSNIGPTLLAHTLSVALSDDLGYEEAPL